MRASMSRLRATSTKKISRLRQSVIRLFHTLIGVCGIRIACPSGFMRMFFLIHSTSRAGFFLKRAESLAKTFSKNLL